MVKHEPEIELRQEEIREILGVIPSWIIRWGTILIASVVLLLLIGAAWFRYPDRIKSQVAITTANPPVIFNARKDGRILVLQVKDSDSVKVGQLLGILESSADYREMLKLDTLLKSLKGDSSWMQAIALPASFPSISNLGEWQGYYSSARKTIKEWQDFVNQDTYAARIKSLKKQLVDYKVLYDRQYRQRQIRSEELGIQQNQLTRVVQLQDSGALAKTEMERAKSAYLNAEGTVELARSQLSQTRIEMDRLEYQIISVQKEFDEFRDQKLNAIMEATDVLSGVISNWKLNYIFVSPVDGIISFTRIWSVNQQIHQGERVMTIINGQEDQPIGKLLLPIRGAGKVKAGQRVIIRVEKFPYMEYGMVKGLVGKISLVADQDFYSVEIMFPEGLKTTYSKELEFSQGMTGQAEIITEDMSLLVRIVNPLKSLIRKNGT